MTLFIKGTTENSIILPTWLIDLLKLQEGELAPQWPGLAQRLAEMMTVWLTVNIPLDNLPVSEELLEEQADIRQAQKIEQLWHQQPELFEDFSLDDVSYQNIT